MLGWQVMLGVVAETLSAGGSWGWPQAESFADNP